MPEPECSGALFVFDPKFSLSTQNKISNLFQLSASSDTGWVNYLCGLLEELEWDARSPSGLEDQLHTKKQGVLHEQGPRKSSMLSAWRTSLRCQSKRWIMRVVFDLRLFTKKHRPAQKKKKAEKRILFLEQWTLCA